jgi:hypothetical protein
MLTRLPRVAVVNSIFNSQSETFNIEAYHHPGITSHLSLTCRHQVINQSRLPTNHVPGTACRVRACYRHGQPPCPQLHPTGHPTLLVGSLCRTNRPGPISRMSSPETSGRSYPSSHFLLLLGRSLPYPASTTILQQRLCHLGSQTHHATWPVLDHLCPPAYLRL